MNRTLKKNLKSSKSTGERLAHDIQSGVMSGTKATMARVDDLRHRSERAQRRRNRRRAAGLAVPAAAGAAAWVARRKRLRSREQ